MSFIGRIVGFVGNLEKSIDADFQQGKKKPEVVPVPVKDVTLEQMSDSDSLVEEFMQEHDVGRKKQKMKDQLAQYENEINALNEKYETLEKLKNAMTPKADSSIIEYETRKKRYDQQYKVFQQNEVKLNEEIKPYLLANDRKEEAESKYEEILAEVKKLTDELNSLTAKEKVLFDNSSVAANSEAAAIDSIAIIEKTIDENEKNIIDFRKQSKVATQRISKLSQLIEQISVKLGATELEMRGAQSDLEKFQNTYETLKSKKDELIHKIENAEEIQRQNIIKLEEKKKQAQAAFARSELLKLSQEESVLKNQQRQLQASIEFDTTKRLEEISSYKNRIEYAENESNELQERISAAQNTAPVLISQLENQIDSLKTAKKEAEMASESILLSERQKLAEIEAQKIIYSNILKQISDDSSSVRKELWKLERESNRLSIDSETIKVEIESYTENLNNNNSSELQKKLQKAKEEQTILKQRLALAKDRESGSLNVMKIEKQKLLKRLKNAEESLKLANKPTPFVQWKNLTQKCAQIDEEKNQKEQIIAQGPKFKLLFDQAISVVAENQERIDRIKSAIDYEKAEFQKRLLDIVG